MISAYLLIQDYWDTGYLVVGTCLCASVFRKDTRSLAEAWTLSGWAITGNIPPLPHNRLVTLILLFLPPEEMSLEFTLLVVHHCHICILNKQTIPNGGEPQTVFSPLALQ